MGTLRMGFAVALLLLPVLEAANEVHPLNPDAKAKVVPAPAPPAITEQFKPVLPCNNNTTLGQEGCAEHEVVAADRQLNADIKVVFGLLADDTARQDFVAAQMAWTRYRSADCSSQSDVYEGGTEQPVLYGLCLASDDVSRRQDMKEFFVLLTQGQSSVPKFP